MITIGDDALDAAAEAIGNRRAIMSTRQIAREAIEAALPHLTADGETPDQAFARGAAIGRAEGEAAAIDQAGGYPPHWGGPERQNEREHRERMAALTAETEARILAERVTYPSDYEVWRDALQLAVEEGAHIDEEGVSSYTLLTRAQWFRGQLVRLNPDADPDCPHCGADSSMDHNEDCPNAVSVEDAATDDLGND